MNKVSFQANNILLISTFAIGCAAQRPPAKNAETGQTRTFYPPTLISVLSRPAPQPSLSSFTDLRTAVERILAKQPRVLSFGEIHKQSFSPFPSTAEQFAALLPILVKNGYHDLVLESLPFGEHSQAESEAFLKTGVRGPLLTAFTEGLPDEKGIMAILNMAKDLADKGIELKLHGIHARDLAEYEEMTRIGQANISQSINERMLTTINDLSGRKVVTYTGAQHNNLMPVPGEERWSNGQALKTRLGNSYAEIDLYLPELINNVPPTHLGVDCWQAYVPTMGVNQISYPNGRIVIVLQASGNNPIQLPVNCQ